jgi:hypothetical protein
VAKGISLRTFAESESGRQLSEEVGVISGVLQGSVSGSLQFLAYVNDIWRNTETNIRLFTDDF